MSVLEKGFIPGYFSIVYALYNNELQNKFHWFHEDLRIIFVCTSFDAFSIFRFSGLSWTKGQYFASTCWLIWIQVLSRSILGMILQNLNLFWHNPVVNWMKLVYHRLIIFSFLCIFCPNIFPANIPLTVHLENLLWLTQKITLTWLETSYLRYSFFSLVTVGFIKINEKEAQSKKENTWLLISTTSNLDQQA